MKIQAAKLDPLKRKSYTDNADTLTTALVLKNPNGDFLEMLSWLKTKTEHRAPPSYAAMAALNALLIWPSLMTLIGASG